MKIVLMYHDIFRDSPIESGFQNPSAYQYKIQEDEFERHIKAVAEYTSRYSDIEVEITFDDGGVSFLTLAAPILEKYNLKGFFFISTKFVDSPLFLTIDQVKELQERGHVLGSHSHSHPVLTDLPNADIAEEWNTSIQELKKWGINTQVASIPNGDGNEIVIRKAKEAGVKTLYTSIPTTKVVFRDGMQVIGRYVIYQGMNVDDVMAIVTSRSKRDRMYIKWSLLLVVKSILGQQYNRLKQLLFNKK